MHYDDYISIMKFLQKMSSSVPFACVAYLTKPTMLKALYDYFLLVSNFLMVPILFEGLLLEGHFFVRDD